MGHGSVLFSNGVYYQEVNNVYEVAEPPIGVIVSELPDGAEKVTIDNMSYYEYYGTLYKSVRTNNGHGYQVVGKINDEN